MYEPGDLGLQPFSDSGIVSFFRAIFPFLIFYTHIFKLFYPEKLSESLTGIESVTF